MSTFKAFLRFEYRKSMTRWNVIVLVSYFLLSMYMVHTGVNQYDYIENGKKEFLEIENLKVRQWNNYTQYGGHGIRLYLMPSPLSIFFHNINRFTGLTSRINVGEKLDIYASFKGKKIFAKRTGILLDFSGLVLLFGSFIALFYGFDASHHREYSKFLAAICGHRRLFPLVWGTRALLLCTYFLITAAAAVGYALAWGIVFPGKEYGYFSIFLLMVLLMVLFFFSVGCIIGSIKSRYKVLWIVLTWFTFVYLLPMGISLSVEKKSQKIPSDYPAELEKIKIIMDVENEAKEKTGEQFNKLRELENLLKKPGFMELNILSQLKGVIGKEMKTLKVKDKQAILAGWLNEIEKKTAQKKNEDPGNFKRWEDTKERIRSLKKKVAKIQNEMMGKYVKKKLPEIQNKEETLKALTQRNVNFYQVLASLFPSTFYLGFNNEISSRGYQSAVDFHGYSFEKKKEFTAFYTANRFVKGKPKSFIKGDENIFKAEARLPWNFGWGMPFLIFYFILAFSIAYRRFEKSIFPLPGGGADFNELPIELNKGESNVVLTNKKNTLGDHLYNVLSFNNKGFTGSFSFDGVKVTGKAGTDRGIDFMYVCQPDKIRGKIKAGDFISFVGSVLNLPGEEIQKLDNKLKAQKIAGKNFSDLEDEEKARILLDAARMKPCAIYMFNDFAKGLSTVFIKEFIDRLKKMKEKGASILYITNDFFLARRVGDYVSSPRKDAASMTTNF